MGRQGVPWDIHPLQGIGTAHPRTLDSLLLWMLMTVHTKVQSDGLDERSSG